MKIKPQTSSVSFEKVDMEYFNERCLEPALLQLESHFMEDIKHGYESVKPILQKGKKLIKEGKRGDLFYLISSDKKQIHVHTRMEHPDMVKDETA